MGATNAIDSMTFGLPHLDLQLLQLNVICLRSEGKETG